MILAGVGICTSLSLLYAARQPRLFRATANIAIYRDTNTAASLGKDNGPETSDIDEYTVSLETQLRILQSRTLALDVVRKLRLDQDPEFVPNSGRDVASAAGDSGNPPANEAESAAIDSLLAALSVTPIKETRVVQVSFTGPKSALDAKIVNTLVNDFIEDSIRSRYDASNRAATVLSGQLTGFRAKVEESQKNLVTYEREHNILGVDEKQNVVTTKLDDLNKQLTAAEADRIEKESLYQTINAGSLDQIPESKAGEALQNLRLREAELKNEFAQANTTFGPNHPKVVELTNRIKAIDASIQAELKRLEGRAHEEYQSSVRREQKLRAAFEAQKKEANLLNESAIQYGILKREVDSDRQIYDSLQDRMKEAGVLAGLRSSNIRLIDAAEPPGAPVSPNLPRSGYIGLFVGFLASAALVAIREGMDRALHGTAEVESFTAMPSLAVIPQREYRRPLRFGNHEEAEDVVCLTHPRSAIAEAYRALGTSIMLASPNLKSLLVTSPLPGEGKTTIAANSAVVIAQQGRRVLLVDADLRKPGLHLVLQVENKAGLADLLLGRADTQSTIKPYEPVANLHVLTGGAPQSMPVEMLGSSKMSELMIGWREHYDYVILDTPPMLAVTDAVRLSSEADSTLLILRDGRTPRESLARSCQLLNQSEVPVLGIVVNGVKSGYGASYYYGYSPELAKTYYHDARPS